MQTTAKKKKGGFTPHLSQKGGVKLPVILFQKKGAGFTLIELLVVIAIIGIVAALIVVSVSAARTRAKDARVITDLNQIRTAAEVINSADGNYTAVLTDANIGLAMNDMSNQGATNILRTSNAAGYCVEALMVGGKWGCVNSGLATVFNCVNATVCAGSGDTPTNISCSCP